jgi:AraC-like DNA-binding protein
MKMKKEPRFAFSILSEFEKQLPYYLVGVGHCWEQEPISRPFGYPFFQWIQTLSGKGEVHFSGTNGILEPGQGMMLFPEGSHEYRALEEPWVVNWFTFGGHHIENMLKTAGIDGSGIYAVSNPRALEARAEMALNILFTQEPTKGLECSTLVYGFLLDLYKYITSEEDSVDSRYLKLQGAFSFIEESYSGPISIQELADSVGFSPQYFCRLFKRATGMRPFEYLNYHRVGKAKQLLSCSSRKISDIAEAVGYESEGYFCTIFRKFEGINPSKFREIHRGAV